MNLLRAIFLFLPPHSPGAICASRFRLLRLLFFITLVSTASAVVDERTHFPQSLAPVPSDIARTMRAPTAAHLAQTLEFQVPLRMRNYQQLQQRIARGEIVPRAEMDRDYFPSRADYVTLKQWLVSEGFRITLGDPCRLGIFAQGTLTQIQRSFQVEMTEVTVNGREYHAARTHPSLPRQIASSALGVNGLQPFLGAKKHQPVLASLVNHSPPFVVSEILNAYNATNLGVSGSGQKIAILINTVANNSDLTTFWANNSIVRTGTVELVNVNNATLAAPSGEETLDEEWTSGIAPGADIRVYATSALDWVSLDKGLIQIINDLPSQPHLRQLSISMGLGEIYLMSGGQSSQMTNDSQYMATLASSGVSVFVSSGDGGSNPTNTGVSGGSTTVEYYSSDPSVTGVGGTSLTLDGSGNVTSETAWAGSGGGVSVFFSRPSWQVGAGVPAGTMRLVPDVALDANPNTGAYVIMTVNGVQSVYQYGGTSFGTPVWAGFCALINEARANASLAPMGLVNPRIYPFLGTANFRDVISGKNGGYSAGVGYDQVTGIGVPVVNNLLNSLLQPMTTGFTPTSGATFTTVILSGLNFANVSSVSFNGTGSSFTVNSESQITTTVPVGATTGPVVVTTPFGSGTSAANFTVTVPTPPDVIRYTPTSGTAGSTVILTGSSFVAISNVSLNGVSAPFTVNSSNQITATVPAGAVTGPIIVTNAIGSGTGFGVFYVTKGSAVSTLYTTSFETSEGYSSSGALAGQKGWIRDGTGGTGFKSNFLSGQPLSAYLGYTAPTSGTVTSVWQPINHTPAPGEVVTFSVLMQVRDSTLPRRDTFRWSVRNVAQAPLFSIEFNNANRTIHYVLDDGSSYVNSAGFTYGKNTTYTLTVTIDFFHNLWSATLGSTVLATGQPITTLGASLDLGDIDAVWMVQNPVAGNNYLVFDNNTITANIPQFSIDASASPANGGAISGTGTCASGSSATLLATPNLGFVFTGWTEGGAQVSSSASYSFAPESNRVFTANFLAAFTAWASRYFTPDELAASNISGPLAAPNGDGVPNLLYYAFNANPRTGDRSVLPRVAQENGFLTLTYTVNPDATDLTYTVEVSSDCVTWQSGSSYTSDPVPIPGTATVKVTDLTPITPGSRSMMRLRVAR